MQTKYNRQHANGQTNVHSQIANQTRRSNAESNLTIKHSVKRDGIKATKCQMKYADQTHGQRANCQSERTNLIYVESNSQTKC